MLNVKCSVDQYAEVFTASRHLVPDLYWRDEKFDLEYDSDEFHSDVFSLEQGALRTLALRAMDVQVLSITREVVYDLRAMEGVARITAKALGQRFPTFNLNAEEKQRKLRQALLQ